MLGSRELIVKIHGRGIVDIIVFYDDPLRRVIAGEIGPLDAGTDRQIIFCILDPPCQGRLV